MVNTGKSNNSHPPPRSRLPALTQSQESEGGGPGFLPPWSQEVARLPPHKGKTCQLAKNWGLRPQLTICTSQMSTQRKKGCSHRRAPEEHRLRVRAGSVLAGR